MGINYNKRKEKIMQKQFCLVTEPWIKAIDLQGEVKELSLKNAFAQAHEIRCLAGELPNQDFAVLRFLLAILQTVMYRYEQDGTEKLLTEPEDAIRRWKTVWESKKLPETVMDKYLEEWKERFYLFHPTHPFYQIPGVEGMGTSISPGRMIAAVGESDNKARIFGTYSTRGKNAITDAELTRWILHFQAYDTKSTKIIRGPVDPERGKLHPRIAWCGNLGAVYLEGDNLFETLMLNLVLLRTDMTEDACFAQPKPLWERDVLKLIEDNIRTDIDNQAELLSMPCRWLFVSRKQDTFSASSVVGENLDPKNAFLEQMTLWRPVYVKAKEGPVTDGFIPSLSDYTRESIPDRTDFGRGMWNRFSAITSEQEDARKPGIVLWMQKLTDRGILSEEKAVALKGIDTVYHKQQGSMVMDVKGSSIDIRLLFLGTRGKAWREMLDRVIRLTNQVAEIYATFYMETCSAIGHSYNGNTFGTRSEGAEMFYGAVDAPLRKWLSEINNGVTTPDESEITPEMFEKKWEATAFRTLDRCAKERIRSCGMAGIRIIESETATSGYTGLAACYDKLWFTIRKVTDHALDEIYWNMDPHSDRADEVCDYVREKINQYRRTADDPKTVRELALLRRSVGRDPEEAHQIAQTVLQDFEEIYRAATGYTRAERAVFAALALYAKSFKDKYEDGHTEEASFGCAVRLAATDKETGKEDADCLKQIVRYMNRILSADYLQTLVRHADSLFRVQKGRMPGFDYGWFAKDLFLWQIREYNPSVKLAWSADFLRRRKTAKLDAGMQEQEETGPDPGTKKTKKARKTKK